MVDRFFMIFTNWLRLKSGKSWIRIDCCLYMCVCVIHRFIQRSPQWSDLKESFSFRIDPWKFWLSVCLCVLERSIFESVPGSRFIGFTNRLLFQMSDSQTNFWNTHERREKQKKNCENFATNSIYLIALWMRIKVDSFFFQD